MERIAQNGAFANLSAEERLNYGYPRSHCDESIGVDFITGGDHAGDGNGAFRQVAKTCYSSPKQRRLETSLNKGITQRSYWI